jgi:hypothetical protein
MSISPTTKSRGDVGETLLYFGGLTLWIYIVTPVGYLLDIQTAFMLKNQLHATPTQISTFRLVTALPAYVAFVFGLARDMWSPLGLRDRGYFLIFAPLTAMVFAWIASAGLTYARLLIGMFLATVVFRFVMAAYGGLIALIGQEKLMSGRLSTVWNTVSSLPVVAGAVASGFISTHLRPTDAFLLGAALSLLIALQGLWKPRAVFSHAYDRPQARTASFVDDVKRLVRHRAIYPAVLICFLWNFAPGANTPLQFYLSDTLHASDAVYSYYNAIFAASFIPTFLLFGYLCKRVSLDKLLWWGTIAAIPQMTPLALINSGSQALWLAIPIGLMGGVATAAYYDLAMRSCPPGLQGTLMMMVDGVLVLSARGGDVLGTAIYRRSPAHGFLWCVIAITIVYALILPLIALVPRHLIRTADGQGNPHQEAEVLAEIGQPAA